MENQLYAQYASRFAEATLSSLVETFNAQVGHAGFGSARAAHDLALIDEFKRRGIDVSVVVRDGRISFARPVALDAQESRLVVLD